MSTTSAGTRAPMAADAKGQSTRAFWDPRAPAHSEEESEDEENDPSSIADVFADVSAQQTTVVCFASVCFVLHARYSLTDAGDCSVVGYAMVLCADVKRE